MFGTEGSRGDFSKDYWKAVNGGSIKIVTIPGAHAGMRVDLPDGESNFIHEPNVQFLAQKLGKSPEASSQN